MQKGNEHKIDEALNSLNGIKRAEANAYTFEKVMMKLSHDRVPVIGIRWGWVTVMTMLIVVNTGVVVYSTQSTTANTNGKERYYEDLGIEMGYNNGYDY